MKWTKKILFQWWQQYKRYSVVTFIFICIILVILIFIGYSFDGTGFSGGNQVTISRIISGPSKGAVTQTEIYQQGKTLWDWLQLLVVPAGIAIGGSIISVAASKSEQNATAKRDKTEREIAKDNQCEEALQSYIDKMSELLLEKQLRNSSADDEIRQIARLRTLTVLLRLDNGRKKSLIQFLQDSKIISAKNTIVELEGVDLQDVSFGVADLGKAFLDDPFSISQLRGLSLSETNLSGVNLSGANLSEVALRETNLSGANLRGANMLGAFLPDALLNQADLRGADLRYDNMMQVTLIEADLRGANLSGAILEGAELIHANLSGANLSGAILEGADLREAELRGADLSNANLSRADLSEGITGKANLSGANLSGTDLRGAKVTIEQIETARLLKGTIKPDGSIYS